jgi:transposase-like protein
MTHQENYNLSSSTIEEMTRNGLEAIPELVRVILNSVMQAERSNYLQANAYGRTEERKGHANGYKPKTVRTRVGEIQFDVPQVRQGDFYPDALEKGLRSERALTLALAEMYVQGVSTRRVAVITEHLCGTVVNSMQVSMSTEAGIQAIKYVAKACPKMRPVRYCTSSQRVRATSMATR